MDSLNAFMNEVKRTANEATGMSGSIDDAAAEVTAASTQITSNIGSLRQQFDRLQAAVNNAIDALQSMTSFIVTVITDINDQNASISESANSIAAMTDSISRISDRGREKAQQITGLKNVAAEGEQTVSNTESLLVGITTQLDEVYSFIEIIVITSYSIHYTKLYETWWATPAYTRPCCALWKAWISSSPA